MTQGTFVQITWTGADVADHVTVSLAVTDGDLIAIQQITEDGTTEFADVAFHLEIG